MVRNMLGKLSLLKLYREVWRTTDPRPSVDYCNENTRQILSWDFQLLYHSINIMKFCTSVFHSFLSSPLYRFFISSPLLLLFLILLFPPPLSLFQSLQSPLPAFFVSLFFHVRIRGNSRSVQDKDL